MINRNHATNSMLKWFVDEQGEEESNAENIIRQLKLTGDSGHGLYMLDREPPRFCTSHSDATMI